MPQVVEAALQGRNFLLKPRHSIGQRMFAVTAALRFLPGGRELRRPAHPELIALAPLRLGAEMLVLIRKDRARTYPAAQRFPTLAAARPFSVTCRTIQSMLDNRLLK